MLEPRPGHVVVLPQELPEDRPPFHINMTLVELVESYASVVNNGRRPIRARVVRVPTEVSIDSYPAVGSEIMLPDSAGFDVGDGHLVVPIYDILGVYKDDPQVAQ